MRRRWSVVAAICLTCVGCTEQGGEEAPTGPISEDSGADQPVAAFADSSLEMAVREALRRPDGSLSSEILQSLTELVARDRGIVELRGIEALGNLRVLDLGENAIRDISRLSELVHLEFLDLGANQITDIDSLAGLGQLTALVLDHNPVADLSPLLEIASLTSVELTGIPLGEGSAEHLAALEGRGVAVSMVEALSDPGWTEVDPRLERGPGARIMYSGRVDDDAPTRVMVMHSDGGDGETLLSTSGTAWGCHWSPDGERIIYATGGGIWSARSDGTGDSRLLLKIRSDRQVVSDPIWSPDGSKIAFAKGQGSWGKVEDWQIYLMSATGTDTLRVTNEERLHEGLSWSPNGDRIAYSCYRGGTSCICVVALGDTGAARVTPDRLRAYDPAWSPDGDRIAFVSVEGIDDPETYDSEIYVMDADGQNLRRLMTGSPGIDGHPTWSPDSQEIAFHSRRDGNYDIFVTSAEGGEAVNLTSTPLGDEWDPEWSP